MSTATIESNGRVSPVLAAFAWQLHHDAFAWQMQLDWDGRGRQRLKLLLPRLNGTAGDGLDERRGWLCVDWLVRVYTPAWLELAGTRESATALRALPELSPESLPQARSAVDTARSQAAAACGDAACDDAACDDADGIDFIRYDSEVWKAIPIMDYVRYSDWASASGARAACAAISVAYTQLWDHAWAGSGTWFYDALHYVRAAEQAGAKLRPTTAELQDSAFELLERLIELGHQIEEEA